ncbi:hypothetical protein R1flu_018141 [Riccia fluitans]|uniref:Uncharacterized protein n=1 Tax=Riccia fluitans TaxID=41844 RepID=A0ABD1ZF71_9MARC
MHSGATLDPVRRGGSGEAILPVVSPDLLSPLTVTVYYPLPIRTRIPTLDTSGTPPSVPSSPRVVPINHSRLFPSCLAVWYAECLPRARLTLPTLLGFLLLLDEQSPWLDWSSMTVDGEWEATEFGG